MVIDTSCQQEVVGDEDALYHIMHNGVRNGVKHGDLGGPVTVSYSEDALHVVNEAGDNAFMNLKTDLLFSSHHQGSDIMQLWNYFRTEILWTPMQIPSTCWTQTSARRFFVTQLI